MNEEWNSDMEAAKDGTWVLVYREGRQYVAKWTQQWQTWAVSAERMPGDGDGAFTDIGQVAVAGRVYANGPTHWRPLPAHPSV